MARHLTTTNQLAAAASELRAALRLYPDYKIAKENLVLVESQLNR
jgi:hypothetical protein